MGDKANRVDALKALNQARALQEMYEGKEMPADVTEQLDRLLEAVEGHVEQAKRNERMMALEEKINKPVAGLPIPAESAADPDGTKKADELRAKAFRKFLVTGERSLNSEEVKALNATTLTDGGYLMAPGEFRRQLIQDVDDAVIMRRLGTVIPTNGSGSLGVPTLDTDLDDADWTTELATVSEDDNLAFGKRELDPQPLSKLVKVSKTLLRKAALDPEAIVRERLAYRFASAQENGFMTGNGANQPLGIFTASADGISTGRDVQIAGTDTLDYTDLIDVKITLKPQYWNRAKWTFHRDFLKKVMKLEDGEGRPLYQVNIAGGTPATILDLGYELSEFAPNSFADNAYVAVLGDFRFYWIAESQDLEIQVLVEKYADENKNGYIARAEVDGMPVKEEAFVRMKWNA